MRQVLIVIIAAIAACGVYQVLARYVVTYRLTETTFDVTLFGVLPFLRFRYDGIEDARRITLRETWGYRPFVTLSAGNRIFGDIVSIDRRSRFARHILITPDDAEDFVRRMRERLGQVSA